MTNIQLVVSETEKVTVDIYCGCWKKPPDEWGGGGEECCFGTSLTICKDLWEDGFVVWCPECGAELADGYGIEIVPDNDTH